MEYPPAKRMTPGRPRVDDEVIDRIVEEVEQGAYVSVACRRAGISIPTVYAHADRRPDLKKRLSDASRAKAEDAADSVGRLAGVAYKAWKGGREDTGLIATAIKAKQWEAERRDPARFGAKQSVELSGGVSVSRGPDMSALTQAQLEALAAIPDASEQSPI
jgi:hypothetical protein